MRRALIGLNLAFWVLILLTLLVDAVFHIPSKSTIELVVVIGVAGIGSVAYFASLFLTPVYAKRIGRGGPWLLGALLLPYLVPLLLGILGPPAARCRGCGGLVYGIDPNDEQRHLGLMTRAGLAGKIGHVCGECASLFCQRCLTSRGARTCTCGGRLLFLRTHQLSH